MGPASGASASLDALGPLACRSGYRRRVPRLFRMRDGARGTRVNIPLRVESHYGREDRYVTDPDIARAVGRLTGRRTVTNGDVNALLALGHTFTEISISGRRIAE